MKPNKKKKLQNSIKKKRKTIKFQKPKIKYCIHLCLYA